MTDDDISLITLRGAVRIMAVLADEDQEDGLKQVYRTREDYLSDALHAVAAEAVVAAVEADSSAAANLGDETWRLIEQWSKDTAEQLALILRTI